tara:strand:+ start:273 stop:446 length:174 start_codon:yes stop_codon:yes gene_type:complete
MFGIGLGEMIIVAGLAILVLGPEKCVSSAQKAGKLLRQIQTEWTNTKNVFNDIGKEK